MRLPRLLVLLASFALSLGSGFAHAFEFRDLWQTPEQRAARQLENDQIEALIEQAPDDRWRGIGQYRSGNYDAAAKAFSSDALPSGRSVDDLYNQATALTRMGDYDQAISLLDEVIEQQPDALDAQENRSIAERLKALREMQPPPEQDSEGEPGEQGEGGDTSDSDQREQAQEGGEQSGESEESETSESGDDSESFSPDAQSGDSDADSGQSPQSNQGAPQEPPSESEQEASTQADEEAMQEAAEALAAEAERERDAYAPAEDEQAFGAMGNEREEPVSEDDQATEQWLRRIPDDPAGLLRRKLEQSHRNDFPEVRDAQRAW